MGNHGRSNYLGLNYQSWAALSLFLQHLRYSDFDSMQLEAPKMQDFDLVFTDGRKVVCEAKGKKRAFGASQLKGLLRDLAKKKVVLSKDDEFLVVTRTASNELKRILKRVRDLSPTLFKDAVRDTAFREADVETLQKVKIYEIEQEDSAEIAFALVGELIGSWLDSKVLRQVVQSILIDKIYHGSAKGLVIKATDFRELLKQESERVRANVGANSQPTIERLGLIKQAVEDPSHALWAPANLSAISAQWGEILFASELLKDRNALELTKWSQVIGAQVSLRISHRAFEIIRNNLHSSENIGFAIDFLLKQSKKVRATYVLDFHETELMRLGTEIFNSDRSKGLEVLEALRSLVENFGKHKLFIKSKDRHVYLHEHAGKLAYSLFEHGDTKLKSAVIEFITSSFCLVEDEGDYWHKAPPGVFDSLRDFLCTSTRGFESRFNQVSSLLSKQYSEIYRIKFSLPFKGYELIGGVSTWWGNAYSVKDRFFIRQVLQPALTWYLQQSPNKAFLFLKKFCVFEDKLVKKDRPDFLRRTAVPVLVDIFRENISGKRNEARKLLFTLSLSKKGMPSKHELIYQAARGISDPALLWSLLEEALRVSEKPLNPFVEKTVCALAQNGHKEAIAAVTKWLSNEQSWTDSLFGGGPLTLLSSISSYDIEATFETLERLTFGKYFNRERREIDVYEWCDFLAGFFQSHTNKVKGLLNKLHAQDSLSESQQVLIIGTIAKLGKDEATSESEKLSLYSDVVKPILLDKRFVEKFPVSHIREQLTDLVEGLVKKEPSEAGVKCALEILEVLVNDPSPEVQKEKSLANDSEVFTIESVRGKTAWTLQHFFKPVARPYLERSIKLLETLLNDKSTYIRGMACYPFSILLANRFTFTTKDLDTPLLGESQDQAFEKAKSLEKRAVKFIRDNIKSAKNITKNIPKLFDRLRLVDFESAKELWELAEIGGTELMKEVLPILIFNGHFRERLVNGSPVQENPFLTYLGKESFDYNYWRQKLEALTLHEDEDLRASLSWHIMKLSDAKEEERAAANIPISLTYFKLIAKRYDQDVFRSIYMFIDEHLEEHFDECINLWFALIQVEVEAIKKAIEGGAALHDVQWWPFCFNGKILAYAASQNEELFLKGIEMLLSYPENVLVNLDEKVAAALLKITGPRGRILTIYDTWIKRDSLRFRDKDEWIKLHE